MDFVLPDGPRVMYVYGRVDDALTCDVPGRYFWTEVRLAESDALLALLWPAHEDVLRGYATSVPVEPAAWSSLPQLTREQARRASQVRRFERARAAAQRAR